MAGISSSRFTRFAQAASRYTGHPAAFIIACTALVLWACSGPLLGFTDTWQLIINTSTTIITFLMVFIIQNTQNRDTGAIQIKLDELIRAQENANNALLDLEELDEKDLERIRKEYEQLAEDKREEADGDEEGSMKPAEEKARPAKRPAARRGRKPRSTEPKEKP